MDRHRRKTYESLPVPAYLDPQLLLFHVYHRAHPLVLAPGTAHNGYVADFELYVGHYCRCT